MSAPTHDDTGSAPAAPPGTAPRLGSSFLWSAAEQGGMAVVSFVMLVVFARWLGPAEFGLFAIVLAVVEVLALLATTLFADALVQIRRLSPQHVNSAFALALAIGVALLLGVAVAVPWFSAVTGHPQAGVLLLVVAASIPMAGVTSVLTALKRRDMDFKQLAARSIAARLAGAAAGVAVVVGGLGVWGLASQHLVTATMALVLTWWLCRPGPRLALHREPARELLHLGAPVLGQNVVSYAGTRLFIVGFGLLLGPEAAGYLTLAFRLVNTGWALAASALGQALLPALARLADSTEHMQRCWLAVCRVATMLVFPAFVVLAVCAADLLPALFGPRWLPAAAVSSVMALAVLLQLPASLTHSWFKALGRGRPLLVWSSLDLALIVLLLVACSLQTTFHTTLALASSAWLLRALAAAGTALWLLRRHEGPSLGRTALAMATPAALALFCGGAAWAAMHALPPTFASPARAAVGIAAALLVWLPAVLWAWQRWRTAPMPALGAPMGAAAGPVTVA